MSFQGNVGHSSRSDDVHRRIFQSHLAYLNQEETPAKLEQRHNLESLIVEYLSLVPHNQKFSSSEIAEIFHRSINDNPNFSAYKAASAFEALEKYATNLLSHPWRKEYKIVKLYSGFYKHTVERQLLGGHAVFHQLGYQHHEEGVLFLDEPVDPDKVARVALDCLTAYVECQIMLQICEKVKSYKCSWQEILNVRQEYVCGIDEAIRILHQMKRTALDQEKQDRWPKNRENISTKDKQLVTGSDTARNYQKTGILVDVSNTWPSSTPSQVGYTDGILLPQSSLHSVSHPAKSSKGTLMTHSKSPSWSEGVTSQVDGYQGRRSTSARIDDLDDHLSGTLEDHIKASYSIIDGIHHNPRFPSASESLPDSRADSWDLLHSPLPRSSYQTSHNTFSDFDRDGHRIGYSPVPNMKIPYMSPYTHPFPTPHMMPLGVPGYPYPIPHDFMFNAAHQCQCRTCCEQQQQLALMSSRMHHKELAPGYMGDNMYNRSERHQGDNPLDINSAVFQLSLDGHNPGSKIGQFPVDGPLYMSQKIVTDTSKDGAVLRSGNAQRSQQSTKRGSFYDNVPSTLDTDGINIPFTANNLILKNDPSTNGPTSSVASAVKPKGQKGTATDLVGGGGSSLLKTSRQKFHHAENSTMIAADHLQGSSTSATSSDIKTANAKPHITVPRRDSKESKKWSCTSCTYYNAAEKRICDMCGRSKYPGAESTPLVSGGRECPQCTLVNRKDAEDCTACGASLKDSPTYI